MIACGDKKGNFYKNHPDTGVQFEGFDIPCWQEAVDAVYKLHRWFLQIVVLVGILPYHN